MNVSPNYNDMEGVPEVTTPSASESEASSPLPEHDDTHTPIEPFVANIGGINFSHIYRSMKNMENMGGILVINPSHIFPVLFVGPSFNLTSLAMTSPTVLEHDDTHTPIEPFGANIEGINFCSVYSLHDKIEGICMINPSLIFPVLPPLPVEDTEETRKNISLESVNGAIDAVVCVLPRPISGNSRAIRSYVIAYARSDNGNITLRLQDAPPSLSHRPRPPVHLTAFSVNGNIYLSVPRSFRGPMNLMTHTGELVPSNDVSMQAGTFSISDGPAYSGFLGEFDLAKWTGMRWAGDRIWAETRNGNIHIKFNDEPNDEPPFGMPHWRRDMFELVGRKDLFSQPTPTFFRLISKLLLPTTYFVECYSASALGRFMICVLL